MKITDEMIKKYCESKGYTLLKIGKTAFEYKRKDGTRAALLKAAAALPNIR